MPSIVGIKEARSEPERMAGAAGAARRRLRRAQRRRSDRLPRAMLAGADGVDLGGVQCVAARVPRACATWPARARATRRRRWMRACTRLYDFLGVEPNPDPGQGAAARARASATACACRCCRCRAAHAEAAATHRMRSSANSNTPAAMRSRPDAHLQEIHMRSILVSCSAPPSPPAAGRRGASPPPAAAGSARTTTCTRRAPESRPLEVPPDLDLPEPTAR